jgi:hypothetical protein
MPLSSLTPAGVRVAVWEAALVGAAEEAAAEAVAQQCASLRRPMIAVLEPQPDGSVRVAVHAEDVIAGNILLEELAAGLRKRG